MVVFSRLAYPYTKELLLACPVWHGLPVLLFLLLLLLLLLLLFGGAYPCEFYAIL